MEEVGTAQWSSTLQCMPGSLHWTWWGAGRFWAVQGPGETGNSGACVKKEPGKTKLNALMCGPENPFSSCTQLCFNSKMIQV